jgi:hypothetical protein
LRCEARCRRAEVVAAVRITFELTCPRRRAA